MFLHLPMGWVQLGRWRLWVLMGTMSQFLGVRTGCLGLIDMWSVQLKLPVVVWKGQTVSVRLVWEGKNETDPQGLLGDLSELWTVGQEGEKQMRIPLELSFHVIRRLWGDKHRFSKTTIHSDMQTFFFFLTLVCSSHFVLTLVLSLFDFRDNCVQLILVRPCSVVYLWTGTKALSVLGILLNVLRS